MNMFQPDVASVPSDLKISYAHGPRYDPSAYQLAALRERNLALKGQSPASVSDPQLKHLVHMEGP